MIHLICPNCGKKLHAKDELEGRWAKCPNCKQPILLAAVAAAAEEITESIPLDDALPGEHVIPATEEHLPTYRPPTRLNRESHYLICNRTHVVASWENNGDGWLFRAGSGFLPAKRARDSLPNQGEFQLVELKFAMTPDGKRLAGIASFRLASRWALTTLDQGDDAILEVLLAQLGEALPGARVVILCHGPDYAILEKITGPGCLNKDQKNAVRLMIREHFMRPIWEDAAAVNEYLTNTDWHSPGVE